MFITLVLTMLTVASACDLIPVTPVRCADLDATRRDAQDVLLLVLAGCRVQNASLRPFLHLQTLDLSFNLVTNPQDLILHEPSTLKHLNLSGNRIATVSKWFGTIKSLQTLDLSSNYITAVEQGVLASLTDLQTLILSGNQLNEFRSKWLSGLSKLQTLEVTSNMIHTLEHYTFRGLDALQRLNLSDNQLSAITNLSLSALPSLVILDVSSNNISTLENGTFSTLTALQRLDLSRNKLEELNNECFVGLSSLLTLDLSWNSISILGNESFASMAVLQRLNLSSNRLEELDDECFRGLETLQTLDLSSNDIFMLEDETFASLSGLQRLDLSNNKLETLGEQCFVGLARLQRLDVSSNAVQGVSPGTFQPLVGLTELVLSRNPGLGRLRQEELMLVVGGTGRRLQLVDASSAGLTHIPAALTRSVSTLKLSGNAVAAVRCGDLDSYPLLKVLDLSDNRIVEVEEDALGRLEDMDTLRLTGNLLCGVPRSLPSTLRALYLERNRITLVRAGDLQEMPHLRELSFRDCEISSIQEGSFNQLSALEYLDLSRNPLKNLWTITGPTRLKILRLSNLDITPLQGMSFPATAPERLELLELDYSPALAQQLLADTATLVALRELRELNLEATGLVRLRADLPRFLPRVRVLGLAGNPWNCSATKDVLWLAAWMRRQTDADPAACRPLRAAACAAPPRLAAVSIFQLNEGDFDSARYDNSTNISASDSSFTSSDSSAIDTRFNGTEPAATIPTESSNSQVTVSSPTTTPYSKPLATHTSIIIHIISKNNSSSNISYTKPYNDTHSKWIIPDKHTSNNKTFSDKVSRIGHQERLILNITVLQVTNTKKKFNLTKKYEHYATNVTQATRINQSLNTTKQEETLQSLSIDNTSVPLRPELHLNKTVSEHRLNDTAPKLTLKTDIKVYRPDVTVISKVSTNKNQTHTSSKSLHMLKKIPFTNQSRGHHKSFDSIMRDEFSPNPEVKDDNLTNINSLVDPLAIPESKPEHKSIKQVKSYNNVLQSVGSFINETKNKLTLDHEARKEKMSTNNGTVSASKSSKVFLNSSIQYTPRNGSRLDVNVVSEVYKLPAGNQSGDELLNMSASAESDSLAGENLVLENATSLGGDRSVFYSSRASDAFSSGVRVTVKDSAASFRGSHPGMFVLLAVAAGVVAALAMALSHCARRRRRMAVEYSRQQDIEVRSMSSIGDLW